ncbi:unnamed protein product [Brachionus calyciflorus]|uniref:Uncharacterized protein n=1 Tax=Brachionus calyciflorus TaxID=104777 RepID=A0A813UDF1_9BILA|nr:unnamed protein product [Brachionus calyciflorus]
MQKIVILAVFLIVFELTQTSFARDAPNDMRLNGSKKNITKYSSKNGVFSSDQNQMLKEMNNKLDFLIAETKKDNEKEANSLRSKNKSVKSSKKQDSSLKTKSSKSTKKISTKVSRRTTREN